MAEKRRHRVLVLVTHVIPYGSSLLRLLAQDPRLDLLVAYCSMQGADAGMDPEFGTEIRWDTQLLEGYAWVLIPNRSPPCESWPLDVNPIAILRRFGDLHGLYVREFLDRMLRCQEPRHSGADLLRFQFLTPARRKAVESLDQAFHSRVRLPLCGCSYGGFPAGQGFGTPARQT